MNIKIRELINYIEIFAKHRQCTNRHVKCIEKIINYEIHSHEYAAATQVQTNAVQMLGCVSRRFGEEHQLRNRFDSFVRVRGFHHLVRTSFEHDAHFSIFLLYWMVSRSSFVLMDSTVSCCF